MSMSASAWVAPKATPRTPTRMPASPRPSTPASKTESPGTWRHPRLDEITRRRKASTFTERNATQIVGDAVTIALIWYMRKAFINYVYPRLPSSWITPNAIWVLGWAYLIIQTLPLLHIGYLCLPLVRQPDDMLDIPLTPGQRRLLGLPPRKGPESPDAKYSTPPRYSRTPSMAGSVASRGSYQSSPLSGPPSRAGSGSPFSPAASPLLHLRASLGGTGRRSSVGSPTPGTPMSRPSVFADPQPSPSATKRASVGLNNKWLYEKGRRVSTSAWLS